MGKSIPRLWLGSWIVLGAAILSRADEPPKIVAPTQDVGTSDIQESTADAQPISISIPDLKNKDWQDYTNRIVKIHVRVKTAWPLMEFKETETSGSVGFTLSRPPGPLVTFSVIREPVGSTFDDWISSAALTSIYPTGYKLAHSLLDGRKTVLVKGTAKDGRLDESYFSLDGAYVSQVSFTAPPDAWKDWEGPLAALKSSFHWLR